MLPDEMLERSKEFVELAEESGDTVLIANSVFALGFTHLWRGELDRALEMLQKSESIAERFGYAQARVLAHTYIMILWRLRGDIDEVRRCLPLAEAAAQDAKIPTYIATAKANRAWVALREGDHVTAEADAKAALEIWERTKADYLIQWQARWPPFAVALSRDDLPETIIHARALLDPDQQPVPEASASRLRKAIRNFENDRVEDARTSFQGTFNDARNAGYI